MQGEPEERAAGSKSLVSCTEVGETEEAVEPRSEVVGMEDRVLLVVALAAGYSPEVVSVSQPGPVVETDRQTRGC